MRPTNPVPPVTNAAPDKAPLPERSSGIAAYRAWGKQAVDQQFARWVMLHVQSNPLPICTRPRVLIKGKRT